VRHYRHPAETNNGNPTENPLLKTNTYLKTWPTTLPTNLSVSHHFSTPSKTKDTSIQNSFFKSTILIFKDLLDLSRLLVRFMIVMKVRWQATSWLLTSFAWRSCTSPFTKTNDMGSWFIMTYHRWMCSGYMVDKRPTIGLAKNNARRCCKLSWNCLIIDFSLAHL